MNLQLNLILPSELRSGSRVSRKFVARALAIGIPLAAAGVLILLLLAGRQADLELAAALTEQRQVEPVHQAVLELRDELAEHRALLMELEGWSESRLDWREMLTELMKVTPANVQFTRLTVNERLELAGPVPARNKIMTLRGKVVGKNAREDIQRFDRSMRESAVFASLVSSMHISLLGALSHLDDADSDSFLFDATLDFSPTRIGGHR